RLQETLLGSHTGKSKTVNEMVLGFFTGTMDSYGRREPTRMAKKKVLGSFTTTTDSYGTKEITRTVRKKVFGSITHEMVVF
ncbi:MAG: hypothetical protein QGG48_13845, partial [Desulfatiglandales bacterium]|nr:hypothetical protein [Desulfatiglandales bacterium]